MSTTVNLTCPGPPVVLVDVDTIVKVLIVEEHMGGQNLEQCQNEVDDRDDGDTDHEDGDDDVEELAEEEVEGVLVELVVDQLHVQVQQLGQLLLVVIHHAL